MFILVISCLTKANLSWLMDLTFQVPMQYYSLQHWTLLSPPDTSTNEHCFCFGPSASLFLELLVIVLHSSPVAYWTPFGLGEWRGHLPVVVSFCLFILFMEFSRQEYRSGLPFPPPVDHVLSHSFIALCKPLCHKAVIYEQVLILGKIESKRKRVIREWDGLIVSPIQWTWIWANSGK